MNFEGFRSAVRLSGMMLALGGMLAAAPSTATSAKSADESQEAARLLREVRIDARRIARHARRFEQLSMKPAVTWQSYDQQWNLIKPSMESMSMKLGRLEAMRGKLSPARQTAADHAETLLRQMERQTSELHALLNRNGVSLSAPAFKSHSARLAKSARQLAMAVKPA